jgi:hypothetical protein
MASGSIVWCDSMCIRAPVVQQLLARPAEPRAVLTRNTMTHAYIQSAHCYGNEQGANGPETMQRHYITIALQCNG